MNPMQNYMDFQQNKGVPPQQPQQQYPGYGMPQYGQQGQPLGAGYPPQQQYPPPPKAYYPQQQQQPYQYDQSMYGAQQQQQQQPLNGYMNMNMMQMQMPMQQGGAPLHILPRSVQSSAQIEHNLILEQIQHRQEDPYNNNSNKSQAKNGCPLHPVVKSKACRTCKKLAAEDELKSGGRDGNNSNSFGGQRQEDDADGELVETLPGGDKGESNLFSMWEADSSATLNSKLRTNILNCNYFRVDLFNLKTYHEVIDEIQKHVNHAEPWAIGSSDVPSTLFCCLYKYMLMKLTVKQVKGLVEYKSSPMVRAIGFLYIRFCCEPKYMFAWYKRHLLDDEEFKPGSDKNSPMVQIGDYVEKLLSDLEYYGTRFPRIPIKIETKIKAKLILNQEKRDRKKANLSNIGLFQREMPVVAISGTDGEWHNGVLEKIDGKLAQVRFLQDSATKFEGGNELVNLGEIELVNVGEGEGQSKNEQRQDERQNDRDDNRDDDSNSRSASSQSRSQSDRKRRSRSKSNSPKGKKKRSRSREHTSKKHHNSRSRSKDRKKTRKHSRSPKNSKSSNTNNSMNYKSKIESIKEREQRLVEEIKRKQADQAVAFSKSDVARIPQSYKTALSGHPSRLAGAGGRSPTGGRKEEFVETMIPSIAENRQKKQQEQDKPAAKQKSQEQIEKELKMLQMYGGDAQTKGSAYTSNKRASDYA